MPAGWGWRLTPPADSSGTKGQVWWQPRATQQDKRGHLSQQLPLVSRGDCSSHAQQLPWGGEEGKAEISSSNIRAVLTQFIKGKKKGFVVKSLVSKTLASVPASATLQS